MTPIELDLIEAEFRSCRKPAEFERFALEHTQRLIDRCRELERDHEAMQVLRELRITNGVTGIVYAGQGYWQPRTHSGLPVQRDDPADALLAWRDQQVAKDGE